MNTYYKPSGKFSSTAFMYFLILCVTIFPLFGLIYAYCIWYIPFIYINFLIAAVFGFGIGFLINIFVINKGKVRNVPLAILLGALGGFIALYFHWAVWVDLVINAGESYGGSNIGITVSNIKILQVFGLAMHPQELFELIKEINELGTWGIKGSTVSGGFLTVIWIIELLIVTVISTLFTFPKARDPFCELDNKWYDQHILPAFQFIEEDQKMLMDLESSNPNTFESLDLVPSLSMDHSVFTMYNSEQRDAYLSIENKRYKLNNKGNEEYDSTDVVKYITLGPILKEQLLAKR